MGARFTPRTLAAVATAAALAFVGSLIIAAIGAEFTAGSMARYEAATSRTDIAVNQFAELVKWAIANLVPVGLALGLIWFAGYAAKDFVPEAETEGAAKVAVTAVLFLVSAGAVTWSIFYWLDLFKAVSDQGLGLLSSAPVRLTPIPAGIGIATWYGVVSYRRGALHRAAREGSVGQIKMLIQAGADPNQRVVGQTPLEAAAVAGSLEAVVSLLEGGAEASRGAPLVAAARASNWTLIPVLLEHGCPPNQFGGDRTAIHIAAKEGERDIVQALIEAGADPTLQSSDEHGLNALHFAALYDHAHLIDYLLSVGVAKYARSRDDRTALDFARSGEGNKKALARLEAED